MIKVMTEPLPIMPVSVEDHSHRNHRRCQESLLVRLGLTLYILPKQIQIRRSLFQPQFRCKQKKLSLRLTSGVC